MAVLRPPNYCYKCGVLIKARHKNYAGVPSWLIPIGDSFIGYENHTCDTTTEKYKEWKKENDEFQKENKPALDDFLKALENKSKKYKT